MNSTVRHALCLLAAPALLLAGCATWQPAAEFEGWTLFVEDGSQVRAAEVEAVVEPALELVEGALGPFRDDVRVHAWEGGVRMARGTRGTIERGSQGGLLEVPGIGPARVRAFHSRSSGGLFGTSGVFIGTVDVGTTVHELVHARFAELDLDLPLWFEEGFAMLLGDGALHEGRWQVDGLSCWPWRELREEPLDDEEIARLLSLTTRVDHSVRENVLVHFLGWAIVFDLYRETESTDWRVLLARFREAPDALAEARRRLARTLLTETPIRWLEHLADPRPAVRIAAAKGVWKLESQDILGELLVALGSEQDDEVRAALAINALATAGQMDLGWRRARWMWRRVFPVLREAQLADPAEEEALRGLYRVYRRGQDERLAEQQLDALARLWRE